MKRRVLEPAWVGTGLGWNRPGLEPAWVGTGPGWNRPGLRGGRRPCAWPGSPAGAGNPPCAPPDHSPGGGRGARSGAERPAADPGPGARPDPTAPARRDTPFQARCRPPARPPPGQPTAAGLARRVTAPRRPFQARNRRDRTPGGGRSPPARHASPPTPAEPRRRLCAVIPDAAPAGQTPADTPIMDAPQALRAMPRRARWCRRRHELHHGISPNKRR